MTTRRQSGRRGSVVVCLVGENGSGKGTVARLLAHRGGSVWKFSTVLSDLLHRLHLPDSKDNEIDLAQAMRKVWGEDVLARVFLAELPKFRKRLVVLDGLRFPAELKTLRKLSRFHLAYVTAPLQPRYERTRRRREKTSDYRITLTEFKRLAARTTERHVTTLGRRARHRIVNDGSLIDLKRKVDALYRQLR